LGSGRAAEPTSMMYCTQMFTAEMTSVARKVRAYDGDFWDQYGLHTSEGANMADTAWLYDLAPQ
jgi:hypothetical protein